MKVYSAQQKLGKEVENHAHAIFLEAMRRVGEMLAETERALPGRVPRAIGTNSEPISDRPPTLSELGLTPKESALAQKIAALPSEDFEAVKEGAMH